MQYPHDGSISPADPLTYVRARLEEALRDVELIARLERAAEATARVRRGALVARELVWDVIGDTYAGTLRWDPDQVSLWNHVVTEVKTRSGRDRRKAGRHTSLVDLSDEMVQTDTPEVVSDAALWQVDPADLPVLLEYVQRSAVDDPDVLQLVTLYAQGITRKAKILGLGMSDTGYRNARRRLKRLAIAAATRLRSRDTPARAGEASTRLVSRQVAALRAPRRAAARVNLAANQPATRED